MCDILFRLYGIDTRAAQILNITMSGWWFISAIATMSGVIEFDIPFRLRNILLDVVILNGIIIGYGVVGVVSRAGTRQLVKLFGLLLGALWHAVLANVYVSQFPPVSLLMCLSVLLSIWLLGAVVYILRCEGVSSGVVRKR